jgi:ABC-2 type transport system permease protein
MKTIKDLWIIARKDLLEFSRDRLRLVTFFIMPVFMMIMTGFIFPNQNSIKNVPIGNSAMSQKLVSVISDLKIGDNSDNAFVITTYSNADEIKEAIKSQEISGGIDIPKDFADNIAQNEQSKVTIVENQAKPQISQMVTAVLTQVVSGFSQGVGTQKLDQILVNESKVEGTSPSIISPLAIMQPITAKLEGIISGNPNYFEFVAPGIVAMIVMTAVLTGLAASVSREKEQGTLDGILISPINRLSIILGKALSQAIRGLVQGAMVLLLAYLLFGVTIHGNLLLIALILFAGIFSFVGFGILVSSIASEQETATQLLFMFQFPMLFLSGVFFPIELMPKIMQYISKAIPLTYAIDALRKVMVLGASISAVRYELVVLLIFGVVTLAISVPVFNKVITK